MEWFRPSRSKAAYLRKPKKYYESETIQIVDVVDQPPNHHHHHQPHQHHQHHQHHQSYHHHHQDHHNNHIHHQNHQNNHIPPPPPPPPPIIVEAPQPNLQEEIVVLNNNQHALHQRMERVEENQEYLVAASKKLLHNAHRQDRRLYHIEDDIHRRSRSTGRIASEHITARLSVLPPRRPLLLDADRRPARLDLDDELQRLRIADRVDRAYIGDGVTYVTSRNMVPNRRTSWAGPSSRRRYAESDTSTNSDASSTWSRSDFEVELPRPPRRRPIVHQSHPRACVCGGIGYHLTDCPRRR